MALTNFDSRDHRFVRALLLALIAHLVLAIALPDLSKLNIPTIDRGRGITVFLRTPPEPEAFVQSLENPGLLSNELVDSKSSTGRIPSQTGEEERDTDAAPEVSSDRQDNSQANPSGSDADAGLKSSVLVNLSTIRIFAQEEAYRHAEDNPDALQRFRRSFRSSASYRKRSRSDSYIDRYGDYYVRTSSSSGDICFKQEKELQPDDFSTNTVMFFSCERGPLEITLGPRNESDLDLDQGPNPQKKSVILSR